MNLVELALTTYTEGTAAEAEQDAQYAVEARQALLRFARACAGSTLSADAADLDWQCTTEGLPENVEEARAFLVPGRPEYLRYRIDHQDVDNVSFDLVRPCTACGHDRIAKVTSLFHLGQLLHQDEEQAPDAPAEPDAEPGPLAAIEALEASTAGIAQLARRLIATYPSLTVGQTHSIGLDTTTGSGLLRLDAADSDYVRKVATAFGIETATRINDTTGPFGGVYEYANATTTIDGVDIALNSCRKLTDDEATAWRAQQDQAAESGEG